MSPIIQEKKILKCIIGTSFYGVIYSHNTNFMLGESCNASYIKGTSDGYFFLRNSPISCFNKKKICTSWLIAEVEHGETRNSFSQVIWMKQMLKKYNVK